MMSTFKYLFFMLSVISTVHRIVLSNKCTTPGNENAEKAYESAEVLQDLFYNETSGLYAGYNSTCNCTVNFWWNSANCITTLADLLAIDHDASSLVDPVFANTFVRAQEYNLQMIKLGPMRSCYWTWHWNCPYEPPVEETTGFLNNYYDDEGWWGLAWIAVYDLTGEEKYLKTAVFIFNDMAFTGYNGTCGAMYWDKSHSYQNAITNELFLSLAAHLATRTANGDYYLGWALRQWTWFEKSGLINSQNLINDGLDNVTCENNGRATYTYNQGVILGGLVELNKASPNSTYLTIALSIAIAAITKLSNVNGILTEVNSNGSQDLGYDGPTFKGVLIRNLQLLQQATGNEDFRNYILAQADSIWEKDRSLVNATLGNVWNIYYGQNLPQGHCAAMDAIVAASAVS